LTAAHARKPRVRAKSIDTPILQHRLRRKAATRRASRSSCCTVSPTTSTPGTTLCHHLAKAGHRVLAPYLRGYGPTRFRDAASSRMAEQAAIGQDLIDFRRRIEAAAFSPFRASTGAEGPPGSRPRCIRNVCAPPSSSPATRSRTCSPDPAGAARSREAIWYQYYFNTEARRAGLKANRRSLCRLLWQDWSPTWHFHHETYDRTAPSFDQSGLCRCRDSSYRHRLGNAPGEPRFEAVERQLASARKSRLPTIGAMRGRRLIALRGNPERRTRLSFTSLVARGSSRGRGISCRVKSRMLCRAVMLEVLAAAR